MKATDSPSLNYRKRQVLLAAAALLVGLLPLVLLTESWAREDARRAAGIAARNMAATHAGLLASELQKYRLLPVVLAEDPDAVAVLRGEAGAARRLNRKLEMLASATNAAVIYLLDSRGRALAASNWRLPTSFVGHDYGYRSYFVDALRNHRAEQFALGVVSGRPGLFLARRTNAGQGVLVVKVEFDGLEAKWRNQAGITLVSDAAGLVALTSTPALRFRLTEPATGAALAETRRQLGTTALRLLPLQSDAKGVARGEDGARFVPGTADVQIPGWQLHYFERLGPLERSALSQVRIATVAVTAFLAFGLLLVLRTRELRLSQRTAREELESEVRNRTAELHATNLRLLHKSRERDEADRRLRQANEALEQANRLASIGQITAGVAHEINQPVAAIQTFSENAATLLSRGDAARASENLRHIVDLTGRIGRITAELRGFARRNAPLHAGRPITLADTYDRALLLIGDRIRSSGVKLTRTGAERTQVCADAIRLEQILINLLQNALDAVEGKEDPVIRIDTAVAGDYVSVRVSDNGPGVSEQVAETLFTPFVTTKASGLGLGLGLARDIARELGGELSLAPSPLGGAAFELTMELADHVRSVTPCPVC